MAGPGRLPEESPPGSRGHRVDGLDDRVGRRIDARQVGPQAVDAVAEAQASGARVQEA